MENQKISHSLEDYLECILMLDQKYAQVRVKDIADSLNVRMSSVNNAIAMLKKYALVTHEPYSNIEITDKGRVMAADILKRHKFLTKLFIYMGVSPEQAETDACMVEHVISEETFVAIQNAYSKYSSLLGDEIDS